MKPNLVKTMALGCALLLLPGCGWIGIGVAANELTDDPEDPTPTLGVLGLATRSDFQGLDDQTALLLSFTANDSTSIRLRFEFRVGPIEWVDVPTTSLSRIDANGATSPLATDAAGNLVLPLDETSTWRLQWNHRAVLGFAEVANVSLRATYRDTRAAPADERVQGTTADILRADTLGRELGELESSEESQLRRGSNNDPESQFRFDTVLLDRGGDRDVNEFQIEYATTPDTPSDSDFRAIPAEAWDRDDATPTLTLDGRRRLAMQFRIDPIASGAIPRGGYPGFWMRVRHREVYGPGRHANPSGQSSESQWSPWLMRAIENGNTRVGHTPVIESATITDPSLGDPGRRWPRLPISFTIRNPSTQYPMDVGISGTYRINSGRPKPLTPLTNDSILTRTRFRLEPGERSNRYLIWNTVFDEGLGNQPIENPPYAQLRVAGTVVRAQALEANQPIEETSDYPLTASLPAGFATLTTSPFVDFRENLLPEAERIWSARSSDGSRTTRELFFTQLDLPPRRQEYLVDLNQQFEAIQLVPQPAPFNFLNESNGVFDIAPTDFDPEAPDCLVWINSKFYYLTWDGGGATATELGRAGSEASRGNEQLSFELRDAQGGTYQVAVFHSFTWDAAARTLELNLQGVSRDPNGAWSVALLAQETFTFSQAVDQPGLLSVAGGNLDGDETTYEIALGAYGTEKGPGLLHYWSIGLDGTTLAASPRRQLPSLDDVPGSEIGQWRMRAWQPSDGGQTELLVVREVRQPSPNGSLDRIECQRLRQTNNGLAPTWEPFGASLDSASFDELSRQELKRVFTSDLDGETGGRRGSDLLLVTEKRITQNSDSRSADLWILAVDSDGMGWRRLANDISALDPDTLEPLGGNSTMFADRFDLADVDGDGELDLVTSETRDRLNPRPHFNYFAASLSGVAGKLDALPLSAGAAESRSILPGVLDANGDGRDDVLSGPRLHLATQSGGFIPTIAGLSNGPQARHRVERLFLTSPVNATGKVVEVLVAGVDGSKLFIDQLEGIGTPVQSRRAAFEVDLNQRQPIDARAFISRLSSGSGAKDLAVLVDTQPDLQLRWIRMGYSANETLTYVDSGWSADRVRGLALLRQGTLSDDAEVNDLLLQDVAFLNDDGITLLTTSALVPSSESLEVPASEEILAITEASADGDRREDLMLLTKDESGPTTILRLRVFLQGNLPAGSALLARFEQPFEAGTAVRSFAFDRTKPRFAEGFLLLDDLEPTSERSEIILIRPFRDPTTRKLRVRLARSPQKRSADLPFEVVVTDNDQDGVIEVIGGERGGTTGLKRLVINSEAAGN